MLARDLYCVRCNGGCAVDCDFFLLDTVGVVRLKFIPFFCNGLEISLEKLVNGCLESS